MIKSSMRMIPLFALCLAAASCSPTGLVSPCDVLVVIKPLPATNAYLVQNDREAAVGLARHKERTKLYQCVADSSN